MKRKGVFYCSLAIPNSAFLIELILQINFEIIYFGIFLPVTIPNVIIHI